MRRFLSVSLLLLCSLWVPAWAQERQVTGKVTSAEDGIVIPGVSVVLKGSSRGASTDANGNYSINVPATGGTLVVSFVGTTTQEIAVGNRSVIDVKLVTDSRQLTEVVVTGVGVATDKRKLGISVESVLAKNLPQTPTASIDQALVGKIAGAQITSTNGTPGAPVNIVLRGINTINRGTAPIILIDGVQVDATTYDPNGNTNPLAILNSIDLNTIERVEVVQGAAAATLYGAQGANGVIQLFSKKGQAGKLNINFSSGITQSTFLNNGGVHKADLHGFNTDGSNNVIGSNGKPIVFDPETSTYDQNLLWLSTDPATQTNKPYNANLKYYDHYAYFFKPAMTYNNSLSLSGGRDKFDFSITASNNQQTSNIINNGGYNRSNLSLNLGVELARGLTLRSSTQLVYTNNTIKSGDRNIIYRLNNARPFADFSATQPDGTPGIYYGDAIGVNHLNPSFYQYYTNVKDNKVDVIQNFNLNYKVNRFLDLDAKYGVNFARQEIITAYGNQSANRNVQETETFLSNYATDDKGEIANVSQNTTYQNLIASAFINTDFQNDFKINLPIKTSTQISFDYRNRLFRRYTTYGLGLPDYTPYTAAQTGTQRINEDYSEPFITYGYLVNQRIDFGDVAGVSGGFRTDYSSAFGQASKPFTFPRGDGYFRLSALKFYESSALATFLPELKFRAAY
ncbi:MAG: TonB-dependent receptor plug, partial [Spirosoma sp.]|nr:TonB-dependent receptor plug [Spirosoma sp.]